MLDALKTFHSFGLADGEIFHSRTSTTVFEYAQDTLKSKSAGIDEGFGVRVLKDRKLGFSYADSKPRLADTVKNAISISKFSEPSPFSFAPEQNYSPAESYDPKVAELEEKEMKDMVNQLADGVKKYSEPVRIVLLSQTEETAIANTSMLLAKEKSTSFMAYVEAKNGLGFGDAEFSHYRVLKNPAELGEKAGLMAREMKSPKKLPAGKYSIIFSPETLSALFGLLSGSFSGELKRRKISKLWDKEGKKMFDEKLTVYDDPFADAGSRSAFDGEGVASGKLPLIENGVVHNFFYSREAAAFAGLEKQGNCARGGYKSPPRLGGSNTVIKAGDGEPGAELKKYLYIDSMHGLHTANALTGDFGAEASIAFLHENGKKTPVRGFMVSENIFNLFSRIECLGRERQQAGNFVSPQIAFGGVSIIS